MARELKVVLPTNELVPYELGLEQQLKDVAAMIESVDAPKIVRFLEHRPVYTLGRTFENFHLIYSEEELRKQGAELHEASRGGSVTFHGPGQLVAYVHIHLKEISMYLTTYLRELESWVIRVLNHYNLDAYLEKGMTGVWVNGAKICAMGIAAKRFVTYHGIGLNVCVDPKWFRAIIPCGLEGKAVTNLGDQIGRKVDMNELTQVCIDCLPEQFK